MLHDSEHYLPTPKPSTSLRSDTLNSLPQSTARTTASPRRLTSGRAWWRSSREDKSPRNQTGLSAITPIANHLTRRLGDEEGVGGGGTAENKGSHLGGGQSDTYAGA